MTTETTHWPDELTTWTSATWRGRRPADSFAVDPYCYPGTRPDGSYAVGDGRVWGLDVVDGRWVDRDTGTPVDLGDRVLVLAYGSNADPAKLSERLAGVVFVLRCLVRDHSAVWCASRRSFDSAVVATIEADPGRVEPHHVLAVTPEQLTETDRWEGAPHWYDRRQLDACVRLECDTVPDRVWVYVGTEERRPVLRVEGRSLRVAEYAHDHVDRLVAG